nr:unnamed protein product [Spirometra erinaceieuropaei]
MQSCAEAFPRFTNIPCIAILARYAAGARLLKPKFWLAIPYVKNVSEATARILNPFGIGVAHKPESTIRQQIMRPKDPLPATEQSAVVYSIPCQNCNARYVGETGKRLCTRLHEHQLAVNREDKLSLVYGHMQQEKQSFAFGEASVLSRAHDKMARLVLESWSSVGTINRAIDLHPAYQALRPGDFEIDVRSSYAKIS